MTAASLTQLTTLADATRGRLLLLLERSELTVSELCAILQLPQSTVSRHLKVLSDEGWVASRADGTSRYYRMAAPGDDWTARLWDVVRDDLRTSPVALQDTAREATVLSERRRRSREYFSSVAGRWDEVRSDLFGAQLDLHIALALIEPSAVVGDLGCGSGHQAELLAPHVARVVAIDGSAEMVETARARLAPFSNVSVQHADLEQLPVEDGLLDIALLTLVLHYTTDPRRVIGEARRAVSVGGRIVVIDMLPHQREDLTAAMGHVWPGFSEAQIWSWLSEAGFGDIRMRPLPADVHAKGPALFLATGARLV